MSKRLALLSIGVSLSLSACTDRMADLERYVAEVKNRKTTNIEPIPQIKPYAAYTYLVAERRDPFVRAEPARDANAPGSALKPDITRNREPLEEFPLDGLRMLGTINKGKSVFAMVKAPDNVVHRVSIGNHMGQNYGKIVKITDSQIDLVEIIPDGFGAFMERPANLDLTE
jgi:type IV pilus assembly protein PilP